MKFELTDNQKQVLKYAKKINKLRYEVQEMESYLNEYSGSWVYGVSSADVNGKCYPLSLKQYIQDVIEDTKSYYEDFGLITAIKNIPYTLKVPYSWWVWVVDSADNMEKEEWDYYTKVNDYMWVGKNDATLIVYDPKNKPYGMEHGWTYEQIGEILEEWYLEVTGEKIVGEHEATT